VPCASKDGRQCLADDVLPFTAEPVWVARDSESKPSGHLAIACLCPAHDDSKRSLQISVGQHKRIIWNCHAGCSELAVRHALIQRGVRPACLPLSAARSADLIERLLAIGENRDLKHAAARLLMVELLTSGKGELPRGAELDRLAARCGISRSEAYRARGNSRRPK
jgi:hypothetical protein